MDPQLSKKISNLRLCLIAMVVLAHAANTSVNFAKNSRTPVPHSWDSLIQSFFSDGICRVASPFFFLISGYLFFITFNPSFSCYLRKSKTRLKTYLLPYLIWSAFSAIAFSVLYRTSFFGSYFSRQYPISSFSDWLHYWLIAPIPSQLWFIRSLLFCAFISPLVYLAIKYCGKTAVTILLLFWLLGFDVPIVQLRSLVFFSVGAYFALHVPTIPQAKSYVCVYFSLLWLSLVLGKTVFHSSYPTVSNYFLRFSILAGIPACWFLYEILVKPFETKLERYSRVSYFIFLSHEPFQATLMKSAFLAFGGSPSVHFLTYLVTPFLTLYTTSHIGLSLQDHISPLYRLLTGVKRIDVIQTSYANTLQVKPLLKQIVISRIDSLKIQPDEIPVIEQNTISSNSGFLIGERKE